MALYQRALELIPGGTQLVSRRPTRYAYGVSPAYASRAKGRASGTSTATNTSTGSAASGPLSSAIAIQRSTTPSGSRFPPGRCIRSITSWRSNSPRNSAGRSPVAEMVRYAKCGGEACAIAVRIARGADRPGQNPVLRVSRLARLVSRGKSFRRRELERTPFSGDRTDRRAEGAGGNGVAVPIRRSGRAGQSARRASRGSRRRDHGAAAFRIAAGGLSGRRPKAVYRTKRGADFRRSLLRLADAVGRHSGIRRRHARHGGARQGDFQRLSRWGPSSANAT